MGHRLDEARSVGTAHRTAPMAGLGPVCQPPNLRAYLFGCHSWLSSPLGAGIQRRAQGPNSTHGRHREPVESFPGDQHQVAIAITVRPWDYRMQTTLLIHFYPARSVRPYHALRALPDRCFAGTLPNLPMETVEIDAGTFPNTGPWATPLMPKGGKRDWAGAIC